ncbi:TPA: Gfo/Idh/MocA family oxidoreductase [Candidatus Poribacteria bacterium]|nr:Gfo/Idh/MocA family oxidoreductase [Candidatus Poribacteria bacterium]
MALYRAAVIGCGRIGSTIDDEQVNKPQFRYPWAHAPAYIEANGVELVAGADLSTDRLQDFKQRWGVNALYTDYRQMLAQEQLDIVSVTTRPEERAEIVIAIAESGGVKAIYATKPMCVSLAEADAMIEACRQHGVILAIACHKNWSPWFQACLQAISEGQIGSLTSMLCSFTHGGHTLSLFRLFAGAPASWVIGHQGSGGRRQGGMILYQNGIRGFITTGGWFNFDFVGSDGWISARNEHADFEMWSRHPETREPIRRQFPNPKRPRSSQQAAIEALVKNIDQGTQPLCPGEYGREALEIAIALRELDLRGSEKMELPLANRSLKSG